MMNMQQTNFLNNRDCIAYLLVDENTFGDDLHYRVRFDAVKGHRWMECEVEGAVQGYCEVEETLEFWGRVYIKYFDDITEALDFVSRHSTDDETTEFDKGLFDTSLEVDAKRQWKISIG